jgi:hypothetical protein
VTQKRSNPPVATDGLGDCDDRRATKIHSVEFTEPRFKKQDFRAEWLRRRFGLSDTMAVAVADLYFLEAAR